MDPSWSRNAHVILFLLFSIASRCIMGTPIPKTASKNLPPVDFKSNPNSTTKNASEDPTLYSAKDDAKDKSESRMLESGNDGHNMILNGNARPSPLEVQQSPLPVGPTEEGKSPSSHEIIERKPNDVTLAFTRKVLRAFFENLKHRPNLVDEILRRETYRLLLSSDFGNNLFSPVSIGEDLAQNYDSNSFTDYDGDSQTISGTGAEAGNGKQAVKKNTGNAKLLIPPREMASVAADLKENHARGANDMSQHAEHQQHHLQQQQNNQHPQQQQQKQLQTAMDVDDTSSKADIAAPYYYYLYYDDKEDRDQPTSTSKNTDFQSASNQINKGTIGDQIPHSAIISAADKAKTSRGLTNEADAAMDMIKNEMGKTSHPASKEMESYPYKITNDGIRKETNEEMELSRLAG